MKKTNCDLLKDIKGLDIRKSIDQKYAYILDKPSSWHGIHLSPEMADSVRVATSKGQKECKIMDKSGFIMPYHSGITIKVYNGKGYTPVLINDDKVGHRIGKFILTRKKANHNRSLKGGK